MKPTQKIYTVENLDCPNCAAKIEAAIAKLDGIEAASLSYTAMQLRVTASDTENLLSRIQQASDSVEDGVIFTEKTAGRQKRRVYTFENIDCPNCAAKIEAAIAKIDGVESASLSYTTGLLHVTADDYDGLLEKIQAASDSVEEGAIFREKSHGTHHHTHHEHEHEHHHDHDHCDCDHDHEHEHEHHHD
ncbi:MAG: cation transporter, partial [Oscillospiraceae bacterium]|nr:cation transporter [Oscillospiraceae bacterium]